VNHNENINVTVTELEIKVISIARMMFVALLMCLTVVLLISTNDSLNTGTAVESMYRRR
jgi:hypothetical protein